MSSGVSRIGDIAVGVCSAHISPISFTAIIISGANTVLVNGSGSARIGDIAISSCGHIVTLITGSPTVTDEGSADHRIGDAGVIAGGTSVTITGSTNVFSG